MVALATCRSWDEISPQQLHSALELAASGTLAASGGGKLRKGKETAAAVAAAEALAVGVVCSNGSGSSAAAHTAQSALHLACLGGHAATAQVILDCLSTTYGTAQRSPNSSTMVTAAVGEAAHQWDGEGATPLMAAVIASVENAIALEAKQLGRQGSKEEEEESNEQRQVRAKTVGVI